MLIGILLLIAVIAGVVYFKKKKNPTYSPEQEAQELVAKAGAEAKQIEDDLSKEVADVRVNIETPIVNDLKKL